MEATSQLGHSLLAMGREKQRSTINWPEMATVQQGHCVGAASVSMDTSEW